MDRVRPSGFESVFSVAKKDATVAELPENLIIAIQSTNDEEIVIRPFVKEIGNYLVGQHGTKVCGSWEEVRMYAELTGRRTFILWKKNGDYSNNIIDIKHLEVVYSPYILNNIIHLRELTPCR